MTTMDTQLLQRAETLPFPTTMPATDKIEVLKRHRQDVIEELQEKYIFVEASARGLRFVNDLDFR